MKPEIIYVFALDEHQYRASIKYITVSNIKFVYVNDICSVKGCTIKNVVILEYAETNDNYTQEFFDNIIPNICTGSDAFNLLTKFSKQCNT